MLEKNVWNISLGIIDNIHHKAILAPVEQGLFVFVERLELSLKKRIFE